MNLCYGIYCFFEKLIVGLGRYKYRLEKRPKLIQTNYLNQAIATGKF